MRIHSAASDERIYADQDTQDERERALQDDKDPPCDTLRGL